MRFAARIAPAYAYVNDIAHGLFLTRWTKVCAPAGMPDFFDGLAATRTSQSFTPEDAREIQVTPPLTFGVNVIPVGRTAFFDGQVHDCPQLFI